MPTYEYACRECGEHLEVYQSFDAEPLTECPACQGSLRKVFGNIGITFKGSGFYKTDSRSTGGKAKSDKTDTPGESKADAKADSKGDAKTETKSEKKSESSAPAAAAS